MEDASRSTLTDASAQVVHALNNTATQFASHPSSVAASGLPIAGSVWICTRTNDGVEEGLKTALLITTKAFADPQYCRWYGECYNNGKRPQFRVTITVR